MTSHQKYNIEVFQSIDLLNKAAAEYIIAIAKKTIQERGRFSIALSGGNTPQKLYSLLGEPYYCDQIEWRKTFIFWGDERCVALDDKENNAHQAKIMLLDEIGIPLSNIHRIPINLPSEEAASSYEKDIKDFFGDAPLKFDLILLGLGENGHTASLFPETAVLNETAEGIRFINNDPPINGRITMTAPLINNAHHILFLVAGENKAKVIKTILTGSYQPNKYPAQLIKPIDGDLTWFVDKAAASIISKTAV